MLALFLCEVDGAQLNFDGEDLYETLEYGDGNWWTSDKMLAWMDKVIPLFQKKFPWARLCFNFDWSSNHSARADDALNVNRMNVNPGGKQAHLHPTWWIDSAGVRHEQSMTFPNGQAKGMKAVLEERGVDLTGMRGPDMKAYLQKEPDFLAEITLLEQHIISFGPTCMARFFPKFHCELTAIELYFARVKHTLRETCGYSITTLRRQLPKALDSVCLDHVRRFFARCRRYAAAYRILGGDGIEKNDLNLDDVTAIIDSTGHKASPPSATRGRHPQRRASVCPPSRLCALRLSTKPPACHPEVRRSRKHVSQICPRCEGCAGEGRPEL